MPLRELLKPWKQWPLHCFERTMGREHGQLRHERTRAPTLWNVRFRGRVIRVVRSHCSCNYTIKIIRNKLTHITISRQRWIAHHQSLQTPAGELSVDLGRCCETSSRPYMRHSTVRSNSFHLLFRTDPGLTCCIFRFVRRPLITSASVGDGTPCPFGATMARRDASDHLDEDDLVTKRIVDVGHACRCSRWARTTSASEKERGSPERPVICSTSCPLPAITITSSGLALSIARAIAAARSSSISTRR